MSSMPAFGDPNPTYNPPDAVTDAGVALQRLRAAVDLAFHAQDDAFIIGPDGEPHAFEVTTDGDGWNEPFSLRARCACGDWAVGWCQSDPEQSDRPHAADLLVAWHDHFVDIEYAARIVCARATRPRPAPIRPEMS